MSEEKSSNSGKENDFQSGSLNSPTLATSKNLENVMETTLNLQDTYPFHLKRQDIDTTQYNDEVRVCWVRSFPHFLNE